MTDRLKPGWEKFNDGWSPSFEKYFNKVFEELENTWLSSRGLYSADQALIRKETELLSAMAYATTGGKRVRPLLMALSFHSVSSKIPWEDPLLLEFSSALEMIHSYSLVHDDLPGMDNDRYRRGKLTVHSKFGEGTGILTGDALLNYAFERGSLAANLAPGDRKASALEALFYLTKISGASGMIGGQVLDLKPELLMGPEVLSLMVEKKTSCLFMGACRIGGLLGGGGQEQVEALTDFARYLGLAYQMTDDNHDRVKDQQSGKVTFANFFDQRSLQERAEAYTDQAIRSLLPISQKSELESFAKELVTRKK